MLNILIKNDMFRVCNKLCLKTSEIIYSHCVRDK